MGKDNGIKDVKEKLSSIEMISRKANIWIFGVPERKKLIFQEILEVNIPDLKMNVFSLKKPIVEA